MRVPALLRRSRTEDRALTAATVPASMLPYADGQSITPDAALRITDAFSCVRALADTAASLPLVAYVRTADGGRERFTGRLADLLAHPSPGSTTANLVGTIVAHLNLHGNCFIGKYRDDAGRVVQLVPLPPATVTVRLVAGEPRYAIMGRAGVSEHDASDVLHIKALSTDGLIGLSPVRQAASALGLARSLAGHADAFARNAGRPGGILRFSERASAMDHHAAAEGAERTKTDFKELFTRGGAGDLQAVEAPALDDGGGCAGRGALLDAARGGAGDCGHATTF